MGGVLTLSTTGTNAIQKDVKDVLYENYMPYAEMVIAERAIPAIDGFKPSQRRILWTLHQMGAKENKKTKSANAVGQTMQYHPHGDSAIYDTLTAMTDKQQGWNVAPISAKGNMGKVFSVEQAAASRYTECGLSNTANKAYFEFLDAVHMLNNYDNTKKEPEFLPVMYPTILTEVTSGIAVGYATSIPSFHIGDIIDATTAIINGNPVDFMVRPEFSTGGIVYYTPELAKKIWKEGLGSISMYAKYYTEGTDVIVTELPYGVKAETVVKEILELRKKDSFGSNIIMVRDETDINGLAIRIKSYEQPEKLMGYLYAKTSLKTDFSVNINVIIDGRLKKMSPDGLLRKWVDWRSSVVVKHFELLHQKALDDIQFLKAYLAIVENVDKKTWFNLLMNESISNIKEYIEEFVDELSPRVFDAVLDLKFRHFRPTAIAENKARLNKLYENASEYAKHMGNPKGYIADELQQFKEDIDRKGLLKPKTQISDTIIQMVYNQKAREKERIIDDSPCYVYIDSDMFLHKTSRYTRFRDDYVFKFDCNSNDVLLIFGGEGKIYKVYLEDIEVGTSKLFIPSIFNLQDIDIFHIDVYRDDKTFICTHKQGYVTFVASNDFATQSRKTKIIHNGYCKGDYVDIQCVDTDKLNNYRLVVSNFIGIESERDVKDILKKSRMAKTRVFNANHCHICDVFLIEQ